MDAVVKLEVRATFTPPALDADAPLAEAKRGNARADLRMMLDGIPPDDLAEAMRGGAQ